MYAIMVTSTQYFRLSKEIKRAIVCPSATIQLLWAIGPNNLVVATRDEVRDGFPNFYSSSEGSVLDVITLDSKILNRQHRLRVYLPAGYAENTLRSFPVMYMQDGGNLFFSEEAFMGQDWGVRDKLALLDKMNAIQQMIIVGVHSADRIMEYTQPGYEAYGGSVVEEVKPYIDAHFRTRSGSQHTGVMGSSLGGVVSFYMGWQWPEIFGNAGCLSSTLTHKAILWSGCFRRNAGMCAFTWIAAGRATTMKWDWRWQWPWQSAATDMDSTSCTSLFPMRSTRRTIGDSGCMCHFSSLRANRRWYRG